ncbi:hypothetical protein [Frankia sp. Cj3]|uniref:hypothetical protein n=1 Tax=Frankia sp. Cj3 TaxID=2880976 RepID=UPI001EF5566A|nr:hypothetical protein [Frankia sp. Cj3]
MTTAVDRPADTPAGRRAQLARELRVLRENDWRVREHLAPHRQRRQRQPSPPGPYDGLVGRALADLRRIGREAEEIDVIKKREKEAR